MGDYYRVDRRHQRRAYTTAGDAAKLFEEATGRPDAALEGSTEEFWYWEPGRAVRAHVYAIAAEEVPERERERLESLTR